ncbi:hypothetical protein M3Y96_01156900 [Aphelenchoides besseyi]|nr:hypothetical protein M3Y96_01156900 [Aphelenchoides besseyi]
MSTSIVHKLSLFLLLIVFSVNANDDKTDRNPIDRVLNFMSVVVLLTCALAIVVAATEINCSLCMPDCLLWMSDIARAKREDESRRKYLMEKLQADFESLRQKNMTEAEDAADVINFEDRYFHLPGIGERKHANPTMRLEFTHKYLKRKVRNQFKNQGKKQRFADMNSRKA